VGYKFSLVHVTCKKETFWRLSYYHFCDTAKVCEFINSELFWGTNFLLMFICCIVHFAWHCGSHRQRAGVFAQIVTQNPCHSVLTEFPYSSALGVTTCLNHKMHPTATDCILLSCRTSTVNCFCACEQVHISLVQVSMHAGHGSD
jgi:hypothetical protein